MGQPFNVQPNPGASDAGVAAFDKAGNVTISGSLAVTKGAVLLGTVTAAPQPVPGALQLYTTDGTTLSTVGAGGVAGGQTVQGNLTVNGTTTLNGFTQVNASFGVVGNLLVNSGNLDVNAAGFGLKVAEGVNAKQGTATLVAGSAVVANTSVTATSRIFLTSQADGGAPGFLRVSARIAGTSFTITSSSGTDTSTVAYEIFEVG